LVRLANISAKKAIAAFKRMGYSEARRKGSHIILNHPERPTITVPDDKELAPGLLRAILSQVGVQVEEFLDKL
jgi:predicted RNA binding protein YcfA (HicA-like mRNA interferase family)